MGHDYYAKIPIDEESSEYFVVTPILDHEWMPRKQIRQTSALCADGNKVFVLAGELLIFTFILDSTGDHVQIARQEIIARKEENVWPMSRECASLIVRDTGKETSLILSGGHAEKGSHLFRDIWEFHLNTQKWECLCSGVQDENSGFLPTPFCAHTSLMLNRNTLLVIGGWPCFGTDSMQPLWAFQIDIRRWYSIPVNMKLRAAPIAEIRTRSNGTLEELQVVVGGGVGQDVKTKFVFLRKDPVAGIYFALEPVIGLQSAADTRIAASQLFWNGLQFTFGGLRPTGSPFCTILDIYNDEFVYRGDPFVENSQQDQRGFPFAHAFPLVVIKLQHFTAPEVLDNTFAALMLLGPSGVTNQGLAFIRVSKRKKLICDWLARVRAPPLDSLDSVVYIDHLARFLLNAPKRVVSLILTLI